MIHKLDDNFDGKGEVKGFTFRKAFESEFGYVFEVESDETNEKHYESFLKKQTPVCIDFENRIYSDTEYKEKYPKSKDFGVWAWTLPTLEDGINKIAK